MTQEEMLKRARELYECSSISDKLKKELESAFPELKESEDEKIIRTLKEIINWGCAKNISVENNVELKDCLAWLEKQGERKTEIEYIYPKFRIGDVIEPIKPNGSYTPVRVLSVEKTTKSYYCESDDKKRFSSIPIRCEDEYKLVEQKPDDKAEPKFKVGDWIVYSRNDSSREILYVYDIRDGRYYFNDNVHFSWSVKECDEKSHLWTIQDAKPGDVLSVTFDEWCKIVIFLSLNDENVEGYGITLKNGELWFTDCDIPYYSKTWTSCLEPATKEQRDTLFSKIKEAGYEWNAEKKELNKIEQKYDDSYCKENCKGFQENGKCFTDWDCKDKREAEQKPAWSEEDEKMLVQVINEIDAIKSNSSTIFEKNIAQDKIDWLKSIKDRVHPQPKQEWSKEDSERILRIHQFIWANRKGDTDEIYQQEQDADWLMSIIPQQNQYDKGYEDGYSAAKYNQWKPTDKQMEDFLTLLDYNIGVFDNAKFMSVNSLYGDLKKNLFD